MQFHITEIIINKTIINCQKSKGARLASRRTLIQSETKLYSFICLLAICHIKLSEGLQIQLAVSTEFECSVFLAAKPRFLKYFKKKYLNEQTSLAYTDTLKK